MVDARKALTAASLLVLLAACGGGGGGGGGDHTAKATGTGSTANNNTISNGNNSSGSTGGTSTGSGPTAPAFAVDETARFNSLTDLAVDKNGNLYVMDSGTSRVRKIGASGQVSSLNGFYGQFTQIAVDDSSGYLFFSSHGYIYKLRTEGNLAEAEPTLVATLSGARCFCTQPSLGFSADGAGNVYALHSGERATFYVFQITPDRQTTQIVSSVGSGLLIYSAIAADRQGNLALAMEVSTGEKELLLVPKSRLPLFESPLKSMSFPFPNMRIPDDMVYDAAGNLYIIDTFTDTTTDAEGRIITSTVREIEISRIASDRTVTRIYKGLPLGRAAPSQGDADVAVSNDGTVYFTDPSSHAIYKVGSAGQAVLVAGKPGEAGDSD